MSLLEDNYPHVSDVWAANMGNAWHYTHFTSFVVMHYVRDGDKIINVNTVVHAQMRFD